jgi:hypothetical protein
MKHYYCLYSAGLAGTWLTWFVNQHKDFPKYKYQQLKTHGVITDLGCDGATWCFTKDTEDGSQDEPMTFDDYIKEYATPESNNQHATHNCIKVLPDHNLSWERWERESEVLEEVTSYASGFIYPYIRRDARLLPFFANRLLFMWEEMYQERSNGKLIDENVVMDMMAESAHDVRDPNSKIRIVTGYKTCHGVDIDALLQCDQYEYNKLIEYLDQPPIDNWEHLVNNYRQQFICRDWKKMLADRKKSEENT